MTYDALERTTDIHMSDFPQNPLDDLEAFNAYVRWNLGFEFDDDEREEAYELYRDLQYA
jgi:hypothetical protein